MRRFLLAIAFVTLIMPVVPGMTADNSATPAPPSQQNDQPGGEELEPEITITSEGKDIHEEYRINGRLYMIKVIPAKGRPYYLIDYEGNGRFRRSELQPEIAIPMWVIKRF